MKKNLLYMALWLVGIMGTLLVGVVDAKSQVINITGFNGTTAGQLIQSYTQNWDDLELYFLKSDGTTSHYTIMDRNMGATQPYNGNYNTSTINTQSFGYHFQWGNNYGFQGSEPTVSQIGQNIWSAYMPSRYARNTWSTSQNWMGGATTTDNIWGGGGNTYNSNGNGTGADRRGPCPEGYYIPSTYDWLILKNAWDNSTPSTTNGIKFASDLLLPPAGYRYRGDNSVKEQGVRGLYRSSSPDPSDANYSVPVVLKSDSISPQNGDVRSDGLSLRCKKWTTNTTNLNLDQKGGTRAVIAFTGTVGTGKITSLGTPTRSHSTFMGRYSDAGFTTSVSKGDTVPSNLYAKWKCDSGYVDNGTECLLGATITFNVSKNGGTQSTTGSILVVSGATFNNLGDYTGIKDGWNFVGWNTNSGATVGLSSLQVTGNITLYAIFSKTLVGTFNAGVGVSSVSPTESTCPIYNNETECDIESPIITCGEGYNTGSLSSLDMTISDNTTYTATCMINVYTVTWKNVDGSVLETDENVPYGTMPSYDGATPTSGGDAQYSYTFAGWTPATGEVHGNITYTATYTSVYKEYTITFVNYDGTQLSTSGYHYGESVVEPEAPTRAEDETYTYTFAGWTPATGTVSGDQVYTGTFTPVYKEYEVTWLNYDGTPLSGAIYHYNDDLVVLGNPTMVKYVFSGWNPALSLIVTGNVTYVAEWKVDENENNIPDEEETKYVVTVNYEFSRGGEAAPSVSGEYLSGIAYTFVSPEVVNYHTNSGTIIGTGMEGNQTFTVIYEPNNDTNNNGIADENEDHFTIEFSGGSVGGTLSGQLVWNDVLTGLTLGEANIEIPQPVADSGYVFGGWEPKTPESGDLVQEALGYTVIWKVDANNNGIADEDERTIGKGRSGGGGRRNLGSEKDNEHLDDLSQTEESLVDTPEGEGYSKEFLTAYEFAYKNGITTMDTIQRADMEGPLTRIAMAKMLSQYAINVLGKKPANVLVPNFKDVPIELDIEYDNGVTLAYQLGIMGINMPNNEFRPFDLVTRGEFATALSRILWGDKYNVLDTNNMPFYQKHIEALKKEGIITQINPTMNELRGYVMLMLLRSNTFN